MILYTESLERTLSLHGQSMFKYFVGKKNITTTKQQPKPVEPEQGYKEMVY